MATQVEQLPNFATDDIPNVKLYGVLSGTPNSQGLVPVSALGDVPGGGGSNAREWDANFTADGEMVSYAHTARQISQVDTTGTGTVAYSKSTNAAPNTFASVTAPFTVEAGAKWKVAATGVSGTFTVHLLQVAS